MPHLNGLGQYYYDCAPLGVPGNPATYTSTMAAEAAAAWASSGTTTTLTCGTSACVSYLTTGMPQDCAVWCYAGPYAGYVGHSSVPTIACQAVCPYGGGLTYVWY